MTAVLASEWLKLRSARSTRWILLTVAGLVGLCALWAFYVARYWDGLAPERQAKLQAAPAEHPLVLALPLCTAALGVLAVTPEYATGMMRSSLTAVPRRPLLLGAKAGVVGVVALVAGLLALGAAFGAGRLIVGDRAIRHFRTPISGEIPWLLSLGLAATVVALVGVGLALALRSTAGSMTALCGLLFVLPGLAPLLPSPWNERVAALLPSNLPRQIAGTETAADQILHPWAALTLLLAYAAVALLGGLVVFLRKDS